MSPYSPLRALTGHKHSSVLIETSSVKVSVFASAGEDAAGIQMNRHNILASFMIRRLRLMMPKYWVRRVEKRPEIFYMPVERARCCPQGVGAKVPLVLGRKEKECVKQCKITDQLLVQMIVLRPTHISSGNGYFERKSMRCSS